MTFEWNSTHRLHVIIPGAVGAYDHRGWSLLDKGENHNSLVCQYVSIHESLHEDLSASTAYGLLLNIYAHLARHDPSQYSWLYNSLIDRAVKTHEFYATYIALLVVADGRPDGILTFEDDYWCYSELALQLAKGLESPYLQYHALTAIARVCMQPDWINFILAVGLDQFKPSDLRSREYPDERLETLRQVVTSCFWKSAFDQIVRTSQKFSGWEILQTECSDNFSRHLSIPEEYDPLSHHVMNELYRVLATELQKKGMQTLTFNGHQSYTEMLIESLGNLIPPEFRTEPLPRAISLESDDEVLIGSFERERLILSEKRLPATLFPLKEVPTHRWHELISGAREDEHLFLISRFPEQLLQQYEFTSTSESFLRSHQSNPVIILRSSKMVDGERSIQLFLIESINELDSLLTHYNSEVPLVGNLSLTSMMVSPFVTKWLKQLQFNGQISILFDRYPIAYFRNWAQQNSFDILYTTIRAEIDGIVRFAFACQPQTVQSPVFLVPCSETLCGALNYYIQEIVHSNSRFKNDLSFVEKEAWWINLTMGHLFREEVVFDLTPKTVKEGETVK